MFSSLLVLLLLLVSMVTARMVPPLALASHVSLQQPPYQMASSDLSGEWVKLVKDDKVTATVPVDESTSAKYGIRMNGGSLQYFVYEVGEKQQEAHELIQEINVTLATSNQAVQYKMDGDFCCQLQLVRTLRPVPSPGFATSTTSIPPAYDATTDSFVTGPLRLDLRPRVATLSMDDDTLTTPWDVYHNVSPADTRGHFLLLPTLANKDMNWRGQTLKSEDCRDLAFLASSIQPAGSLLLCYNSVGAGASQNHIHCHAWPCPPIHGKDYAVTKCVSIVDRHEWHGVEIALLDYPVCCLKLSADSTSLDHLGKAVATTLEVIGDAPFNIGWMNRLNRVEAYVFVRSKERSSIMPSLKLGISEMMGVFHAQSQEELNELSQNDAMKRALQDVSFEPRLELWRSIKARLI